MAEPDPEKLLAQLESARLLLRARREAKGGSEFPGHRGVVLTLLFIVVGGMLALWVLLSLLDQIPRDRRSPGSEAVAKPTP